MKKLGLMAAVILFISTVLSPVPVRAQAPPVVVSSSAEAQFPLQLKFNLSAKSGASIVDVRLRYAVDQESFAQVTSEAFVPLTPAASISVSWTLDMRRTGGLPPGAVVRYWWVIRDAAGGRLETAPVAVQFEDNRYSWQKLTEGLVTLQWYSGGTAFAREVMAAAQQALVKLARDTGASIKKPLKIYVYASTQDLLGALIFPYEWTGAVTYAQFGTIAIGLSPANLSWGKRAIAHELAHAVTHQMTSNPYCDIPRWLDEGLATYAEEILDVSLGTALQRAIASDTLITVRSLASPFSARSELAALSYAQSFSIVDFLISTYGKDRLLELLTVFSRGSTYDDALKQVYGFDTDGLNARWREHVFRQFRQTRTAAGRIGAASL